MREDGGNNCRLEDDVVGVGVGGVIVAWYLVWWYCYVKHGHTTHCTTTDYSQNNTEPPVLTRQAQDNISQSKVKNSFIKDFVRLN